MFGYIVLASGSPRRRELMNFITDSFEVYVSDCEEVIRSSVPAEVTKELAEQKADAVLKELLEKKKGTGEILVIGADTVVSFRGKIFGKPTDKKEAEEMLSILQGQTHEVTTGVAMLAVSEGKEVRREVFYETTEVKVAPMSDEEIDEYTASGDCYDKAGGYGIQGVFSKYISGIQGDYFNVVGFPVHRIYNMLKEIEKDCRK